MGKRFTCRTTCAASLAITLSTGAVTWLQPADDIAVSGIDGLYVFGDSLIAMQNGTTPARIVRFSVDLRTQQILEANTPELGEPTHGTMVGSTFTSSPIPVGISTTMRGRRSRSAGRGIYHS